MEYVIIAAISGLILGIVATAIAFKVYKLIRVKNYEKIINLLNAQIEDLESRMPCEMCRNYSANEDICLVCTLMRGKEYFEYKEYDDEDV